jgi:hypothetical protein
MLRNRTRRLVRCDNLSRIVPLLAVALALVPAAAAKEPVTGNVCGAGGCTTISEPGTVYQALRWAGVFEVVRAPRPARFYTLTFSAPGPEGFRWPLVYVPSRRVLRVDDRQATPPEYGRPVAPYWRTLTRRQLRVLATVTRGLQPFPPSRRWSAPR